MDYRESGYKPQVKLFADGCSIDGIMEMDKNPLISGFTTNPTFMRQAGITDYLAFAKELTGKIKDKPISLEVFSDDLDEMIRQAWILTQLGNNVYVKIPITNTRGESTFRVVKQLADNGVKVNVTACMTMDHVLTAMGAIGEMTQSFISIFAGRIADTGRDPMPVIAEAVRVLKDRPNIEIIWAAARELYNIFQADQCGCHCITAINPILNNLPLIGKNLNDYSLETIKMFANDAREAGYQL